MNDKQGYEHIISKVIANDKFKAIMVAFKGTDPKKMNSVKVDLTFTMTKCSFKDRYGKTVNCGSVHKGFCMDNFLNVVTVQFGGK